MMKLNCKWLLCLWGLAVVAFGLALFFQFFPEKRCEFELPPDFQGRVFARNLGSPDAVMPVYISDFPHTLTQPVSLGTIGFGSSSDKFYLSADNSVIVCISDRYAGKEMNVAAYDFKSHELISPVERNISVQECEELISRLVVNRGGRSEQNLPIPDVKR